MEKRKLILGILFTLGIFSLITGISVSFFNYTKTGSSNTVRTGDIYFNSSYEKVALTGNNLMPINRAKVDTTSADNVMTVRVHIEGHTDYTDGIDYVITADDTNLEVNNKGIPLSVKVSTEIPEGGKLPAISTLYSYERTEILENNIKDYELFEDAVLATGTIKPSDGEVDAYIVIKAYIDRDRVAISDTYDGTESDLMGTTNEWVGDRVLLTATELNLLRTTSPLSFKVRVESNEHHQKLRDVVMNNATADTGITFTGVDTTSRTTALLRNTTAGEKFPIYYYRGAVTNNNVEFGGFCWKIVRTTETGGTKLIYNGIYDNTLKCNLGGDGTNRQITVDGANTFKFNNNNNNSPAYVGYMYGDVYTYGTDKEVDNAYFGTSFNYANGKYSLTGAKVGIDSSHHYTCNLAEQGGECMNIRYYYYYDSTNAVYRYMTLSGGDNISGALAKMQKNVTNSNVKNKIDSWYSTNLVSYTDYLEDTIWCNDRSSSELGGWKENDGELKGYLYFNGSTRSNNGTPSLTCNNQNDAFTVKNKVKGNGNLTNPIALLTSDEIMLAGGKNGTQNTTYYLYTGAEYWSLSPLDITTHNNFIYIVASNGLLKDGIVNDTSLGLRPSVSLKLNAVIDEERGGTGTEADPYHVLTIW